MTYLMKKTQLMLVSPAQTRFQQTHMSVTVCTSTLGLSFGVCDGLRADELSRCSEAEAAAAAAVLSRDEGMRHALSRTGVTFSAWI